MQAKTKQAIREIAFPLLGFLTVLAAVLDPLRPKYDYILLDCGPSLGILTLSVLAAASSVLLPIQAEFQALRGSQQLLGTVFRVRNHINHGLTIKGIVLTIGGNVPALTATTSLARHGKMWVG